jgi:O-antigen/teichoic acid export membrane protein
MTRRLPWTVVSHALSAATNSAAVVLAAHRLGDRDLGSVALVFTGAVLVQAATRCLTGQPLLIDTARHDQFRAATTITFGLALAIAAVVAATAPWWPSPTLALVIAAGTFGLLLQDLFRYVAFATDTTWIAAASDLAWLIALVVPAVLAPHRIDTTGSIVTTWLIGAVVGAAVAAALLRAHHWWTAAAMDARNFLHRHHQRALGLLGDMAVVTLYGNATPFVVAALATVTQAGRYRVGLTAVGPVSVVVTGMAVQALADMSRRRAAGHTLTGPRRQLTIRLVALSGIYLVVVALVPRALGEAAFGDAWSPSRHVALLLAASAVGTALVTPAIVSIRAHDATGRALRLRLLLLPLQAGAVAIGALLGGAAGAAVGLLAGNLVSALPWWRTAARIGRMPDAPAPLAEVY